MTDSPKHPPLDAFPVGLMVTDPERRIVYASRYFETRFGFDAQQLVGRSVFTMLSQASSIICESYVLPLVLHEGRCEEIQLTLVNDVGDDVAVVINAGVADAQQIVWSVYSSAQRDQLYQELVEARRLLERKAAGLQTLSATDELTGLLNRREVLRLSDKLIRVACRKRRAVSLMILDVDNFKQINDTRGHAAGDAVLQALGQRLQQYGRKSDLIGRFGGDEFLCLLPESDSCEAQAFAARLHELVREVEVGGEPLTATIGLATESGDIEFDRLFQKADIALYEAKSQGRNRTAIAGDDAGAPRGKPSA